MSVFSPMQQDLVSRLFAALPKNDLAPERGRDITDEELLQAAIQLSVDDLAGLLVLFRSQGPAVQSELTRLEQLKQQAMAPEPQEVVEPALPDTAPEPTKPSEEGGTPALEAPSVTDRPENEATAPEQSRPQAFSWQDVIAGFRDLRELMSAPNANYPRVRAVAQAFFNVTDQQAIIPALFPQLRPNVISRFLNAGLLKRPDLVKANEACSEVKACLGRDFATVAKEYDQGKVDSTRISSQSGVAYAYLREKLFQAEPTRPEDLATLVLGYHGPFEAMFLNRWLSVVKPTHDQVQQVIARVGIDPLKDPQLWMNWVQTTSERENIGLQQWDAAVKAHLDHYELALLLAVSNPQHATVWWDAVVRLSETGSAASPLLRPNLLPQPPVETPRVDEDQPAVTPPTIPGAARSDALGADPATTTMDRPGYVTEGREPDFQGSRPSAEPQAEPAWKRHAASLFQDRSNLLAVLAGSFLVLAMVLISWGSWNQGPIGRVIASLVLTLIATVGTAWICHVLGRTATEDEPGTAERLFATLSFVSVPINVLLGATLLQEASLAWWLCLAGLNFAVLPLVAKWLQRPLGHQATGYVLSSNALLWVPYLLQQQGYTGDWAKDGIVFVGLALLGLQLRHAQLRIRFAGPLFIGHHLLGAVLMLNFFNHLPSTLLFGFWFLGLAWVVAWHCRSLAKTAVLVSGPLGLFGVCLLSLWPLFLPVGMAAYAGLWLFWVRVFEKQWAIEVFAVTVLATGASVGYALDPSLTAVLLGGGLGAAGLFVLEPRHLTRSLSSLTFGLPLLVGLAHFGASLSMPLPVPLVFVALALGVLAYVHQVRWFTAGPWLVTLGLMVGLLIRADVFQTVAEPLAWRLAFASLVWALVSLGLSDTLARAHRATVLWALSGVGAAFWLTNHLVDQPFSLINVAAGVAVALALMEAGRRAQSTLPFLLAWPVLGLAAYNIWNHWDLPLTCLGFSALVALLVRFSVDGREPSTPPECFLGQPFFFSGPRYFQRALVAASGGMLVASLGIDATRITPFTEAPLVAMDLAVNGLTWALLGKYPERRVFGFGSVLAWAGLLVMVGLELPQHSQPLFVVACLGCAQGLGALQRKATAPFALMVTHAYAATSRVAAKLYAVLGLFLLFYTSQVAELPLFLATALASLIYLYKALPVPVGYWSHGLWAQGVLSAWLTYSLYASPLDSFSRLLAGGLFVSLGVAVTTWLIEQQRSDTAASYTQAGKIWQHGLNWAFYLALAISQFEVEPVSVPLAVGGMILSQFAPSRQASLRFYLLQIGLWLFITQPLNIVAAWTLAVAAVWLTGTFQAWVEQRFPKLRLPLQIQDIGRDRLAQALFVGMQLAIVAHWFGMMDTLSLSRTPHQWLLVLIPIGVWAYDRLKKPAVGLLAVALLPYGLSFLSTHAGDALRAVGLTGMQGLNISWVLSTLLLHSLKQATSRYERTRDLDKLIQQVCLGLAVMVIGLATLGFALVHQVETRFQLRYLVGAGLLTTTALYLRFLVEESALTRALYRIATTMALWAIGFWFIPSPKLVLWMVALPAFYFLFRLEVSRVVDRADTVSAGVLFTLVTFLYVQHQPLQMLLFPNAALDFNGYFVHAPLMLCVGLGVLRLHRYAEWRGGALAGILLAGLGLTLTATSNLRFLDIPQLELLLAILVLHGLLAFVFIGTWGLRVLEQFSLLQPEEHGLFQKQLYWIANAVLVGVMIALVFQAPSVPWAYLGLVLGLLGALYAQRQVSIAWVLFHLLLLASPIGPKIWPTGPEWVFWLQQALVALATVMIRQQPLRAFWVPNTVVTGMGLLYAVTVLVEEWLSPTGLMRMSALLPVLLAIPEGPLVLQKRRAILSWPLVLTYAVFCLHYGDAPLVWPWITAAMVTGPLLMSLVLQAKAVQQLALSRQMMTLGDWGHRIENQLGYITLMAVVAAFVGFVREKPSFEASWLPIGLVVFGLAAGVVGRIHRALTLGQWQATLTAELLIWLCLGLIRWKIWVLGIWQLPSAWDGLILIARATLVTLGRAFAKNPNPKFDRYFSRSAQGYGLLGWGLTLYVHFDQNLVGLGEVSSLMMAALYAGLARDHKWNMGIAALFLNIGLGLLFYDLEWTNIQLYTLPVLISALALAQAFREELEPGQLHWIRLLATFGILIIPAAYNVVDFVASPWYPISAALVALLVILGGLWLRVRMFVFGGSLFLIGNLVVTLLHIIVQRPPGHFKLILGGVSLVVGLLLLGIFMLYQTKRAELLERLQKARKELSDWD